ncbi:MAG: HemK2/MTQ2 family protein methyltransferase [archaeon]|jgi:release factor glutamine methyltransferase
MQVYEPQEDSFLLEREILKFNLIDKTCLDMGTGSGVQTQAMIKAGSKKITCVDINYKALLACGKRNEKFKENLRFIESDLFTRVNDSFDFIAFNPPYLPSDDMKWVDLDGGKKGREIIDKFLEQLPSHMNVGGTLLLLVSSLNDEKEILKVLEKKGFVAKIVAEEKLFFEVLYIINARKM